MKQQQLNDLILQSLEHELGGVQVYRTAVECAVNADLKEEWSKYLGQTETHVEILTSVCAAFDLDPEKKLPSRDVIRTVGEALVKAMRMARAAGNPEAAQLSSPASAWSSRRRKTIWTGSYWANALKS